MFRKRSKKYNMPKQAAGDVLMNVLEACNVESSNINFDWLLLKGFAQTNLVDSCKWIAIGFLFLVLISPIALMNTQLKVETGPIANNRIIIEDHTLYEDHFTLKLAGSNIEYDSIYAKYPDGTVIYPSGYDEEAGTVTFPYEHKGMTIYIPDERGNILSATLSAYEK